MTNCIIANTSTLVLWFIFYNMSYYFWITLYHLDLYRVSINRKYLCHTDMTHTSYCYYSNSLSFNFTIFLVFFVKRSRSIHPGVFFKTDIFKVIGKHLCMSLFHNKVVGWRSANLLKTESDIGIFLSIMMFTISGKNHQHLRFFAA